MHSCNRMVALLCEGETNDRELRVVIFLLLVDAEKEEDEEFERTPCEKIPYQNRRIMCLNILDNDELTSEQQKQKIKEYKKIKQKKKQYKYKLKERYEENL